MDAPDPRDAIPRGRGTSANPKNRFVAIDYEPDPDAPPEERSTIPTEIFEDDSKSLLSRNDSPDVPFEWSVNPYRGCEHGCVYCYARPFHEYLGLSAGLDFETKLFVKLGAPDLLRAELMNPKWEPAAVNLSGVTDCYQPIERRFGLTRRCLEVLLDFRNPASVITKNALAERDADVFQDLAKLDAGLVGITLTTLDEQLAAKLEPRASTPRRRLDAIRTFAAANVPVHVLVSPIIPGLNDHELPKLLLAARDAGARSASWTLLRLPHAVDDLFQDWLERFEPLKRGKILHRIEQARGGAHYDNRFGTRMRGEGPIAQEIADLFEFARERAGLEAHSKPLSTVHFRRPGPKQGTLF